MVEQLWFVLALSAVVVLGRGLGKRIGVPSTILLTLAGLVYAVLPGPKLRLEPQAVLLFVLPPLVYATARRSSLLAIRANLRQIVSLSVLLVFITAFAVGWLVALVVPGMSLGVGMVLGAALAPPDPVAALSVGRRAGIPPRLGVLIEGEGLLNDATALTIYQVAVAVAVGGGFSWTAASQQFAWALIGGLSIGSGVAWAIRRARPWLADPMIGNAVSLAVPFVTYLLADAIHVSGMLAVAVAGLLVGYDPGPAETGASRLQTAAVWQFVEFLLEGLVFLLIGQQLPETLRSLHGQPIGVIVGAAGAATAAVLLVRPAWLVITQSLPSWLHARLGGGTGQLTGPELIALSWAGTRGVISLAAVFAVPVTTHQGAPFPHRELMLFCSYVVVLITLVGQGLTFAPLLRRLKLRANEAEEEQVRNQARLAAFDAAMATVDDLQSQKQVDTALADWLRASLLARAERYRDRLTTMAESAEGGISFSKEYEASLTARRAIIDAQRQELLRWRDSGRLPDASLRLLRLQLDHEERALPSQ